MGLAEMEGPAMRTRRVGQARECDLAIQIEPVRECRPTNNWRAGAREWSRFIYSEFIARACPTLLVLFLASVALADDHPLVVIVVGAEGTPEYGQQFRQWAERWEQAAKQGGADSATIGLEQPGASPDRELLHQRLTANADNDRSLWLILIGHGTFDGKRAKFNLRGEDITPDDLNEWLKATERPVAIVNCSSCSGAFLGELSAKNRVVVTATKSGHEYNFARLGDYLSSAIVDPKADLDKDEQTSLLEAFLVASAKVREFYASESRLTTEHALLDDNGDRLGTPADWFIGLRPTKAAKDGATLDGALARQFVLVHNAREEQLADEVRARRDELEKQLAELRGRKAGLEESAYFAELENILVELAKLYKD
jgi:hypothetical protein